MCYGDQEIDYDEDHRFSMVALILLCVHLSTYTWVLNSI